MNDEQLVQYKYWIPSMEKNILEIVTNRDYEINVGATADVW